MHWKAIAMLLVFGCGGPSHLSKPTSALKHVPHPCLANGEQELTLTLAAGKIEVAHIALAPPRLAGFRKSSGSGDASSETLSDCLAIASPRLVALKAVSEVRVVELVAVVAQLAAADVPRWSLQLEGKDLGEFQIPEGSTNQSYIQLDDLMPVPTSLPVGPVDLHLDYEATLDLAAPYLRSVSGRDLRLGVHLGTF